MTPIKAFRLLRLRALAFLVAGTFVLLSIIPAPLARAATMEPVVTDVTTRAFSIVSAADEPVTGAGASVFADAQGTQDLTASLSIESTSASVSGAHALGLVRLDVRGLTPGTCYYARIETTSASGTTQLPAAPPYLEACTNLETRTTDASQRPINNDLIVHDVAALSGQGDLLGALVLLEAPELGTHPLSAFVGEAGAPVALIDLNNLFESASQQSASAQPGELLHVVEHRGLACPSPEQRALVRFRRVPANAGADGSGASYTSAQSAAQCFFADPLCDDVVDIADAQWVLNTFGERAGGCGFHPDLDLVPDGVIDILDVQSILNRFGESAPFEPRGDGP